MKTNATLTLPSQLPGARLETLVKLTENHLRMKHYDLLFILAGVNNLTVKSSSRKVVPLYMEVPQLVDTLTDTLTSVNDTITSIGQNPVFCQLTGIDLNTYNNTSDEYNVQQQVINEGVMHVNRPTG